MGKIETLQNYIEICDEFINHYQFNKESSEIYDFIMEIQGVYGSEISDFESSLNTFESYYEDDGTMNFYGDVIKIRGKLINFKDNIEWERQKRQDELELARLNQRSINVSANAMNQNNLEISINLEQVLECINHISPEEMSKEEKEALEDKILGIETMVRAGKHEKAKEKILAVLKFLIDKGADALITMLPYFGQMAGMINLN